MTVPWYSDGTSWKCHGSVMMFTSVLVATSSKTWYGLVLLGMNDNDS